MEHQIKLKVEGMTCGHCEASVKRALEAVEGVSRVEVDRAAGSATVVGTATVAALIEAVDDTGFDAAGA